MVTCRECGRKLKQLTWTHLATHGLTLSEYSQKYRDAPTVSEVKPIEPETPAIDDLLTPVEKSFGLRPLEKKYIIARLKTGSMKEAAEAIGLSPTTVYCWQHEKRLLIESIVARLQVEPLIAARQVLIDGAVHAATKMTEHVDSADERVSRDAAADVLDRTGLSRRPSATMDLQVISLMSPAELDELIASEIAKEKAIETKFKEVPAEDGQ